MLNQQRVVPDRKKADYIREGFFEERDRFGGLSDMLSKNTASSAEGGI